MPTGNQPNRAHGAHISSQSISLTRGAMVNGLQWQLHPVDFKTEEGTFSVYLYAINREHAAAILLELKGRSYAVDIVRSLGSSIRNPLVVASTIRNLTMTATGQPSNHASGIKQVIDLLKEAM